MREQGGFIDLRVSRGASAIGDDSVWPSFTDIMTVIVMIFLMALVIMMARNFELDRRLVTSMSAQEESLLQNRSLAEKLDALESSNLGLRETLGATSGERDALRLQLLAELQRIESLASDKVTLEEQLAGIIAERNLLNEERLKLAEEHRITTEQLTRAQTAGATAAARVEELSGELQTRAQELESARTAASAREANLQLELGALTKSLSELESRSGEEISELNQTNQSLSARLEQVTAVLYAEQQQAADRHAESETEIERLGELIRARQAENAALQRLADESGKKARSLQEEFDALDAKYRKLARPARSPAGKYVVDVVINKSGDDIRFRLKEPSLPPQWVSRGEMQRRLSQLKSEKGLFLYTKIIPRGNLLHSEAWQLTQEILRDYDYYSQEFPEASEVSASSASSVE